MNTEGPTDQLRAIRVFERSRRLTEGPKDPLRSIQIPGRSHTHRRPIYRLRAPKTDQETFRPIEESTIHEIYVIQAFWDP